MGTQLTDAVKQQWDAAFNFVYSCSNYDHDYMGKFFKDGIKYEPIQIPSKLLVSFYISIANVKNYAFLFLNL